MPASTSSVRAWRLASIVSRMSLPVPALASVLRSSSSPSASRAISRSPSAPVQGLLVRGLEAGQALVLDPDRRRSPARPARPAGRSGGCRGGCRCPAIFSLRTCSAVGRSTLRAMYSNPESSVGERSRISSLRHVEHLGQLLRGLRRVLDLVGRREDRRRVLGDRQLGAVAVEDRAARAGDGHRLGLLALRLGAQLRAAHALKPASARATTTNSASANSANSRPMRRSTRPIRAVGSPSAAAHPCHGGASARRPRRRRPWRGRSVGRRRGGDRPRAGSVGDGASDRGHLGLGTAGSWSPARP